MYLWVTFCYSMHDFYPRPVLASGYCRCLCLCAHVCINHLLVRTITRHLFKLGSQNLVQRSKTPWLRSLLFWGGKWPWPSRSNLTSNSKLTPFWACPNHYSPPILVRISKFGQQMHFLALLRTLSIRGLIDFDLHPHFWFQNFFFFIVAMCIETVKQSLVCFNAVQGLFHSLFTCAHGEHTAKVELGL